MKKLLVVLFTLLLLTGCSSGYETGDVVKSGSFKAVGDKGNYDILKDLETGCLYLEPHTKSIITPLYDENGEVMGCGEKLKGLGEYE